MSGGYFLHKTHMALLTLHTVSGINQNKRRTRAGGLFGNHVDSCCGFAAAAWRGDEIKHAMNKIGRT